MFGGGFPGFFGGGMQGGSDDEMEEESQQFSEEEKDTTLFYKMMGLEPQCESSQIRKAYLKACQKGDYRHPDKGGDPQKFQKLQLAYDVLSDPEKKKIYDKQGLAGIKRREQGGGGGGMDPFSAFFGGGGGGFGGSRGKQKMKGVRKEVEITLEDAYAGKMTYLQHSRKRNCEGCDGKGGSNVKRCADCKGRGVVTKMVQLGPGMYSQSQQHCGKCKGEGEISDPKDICKQCRGEKIKTENKKIEIAVEPGCYNEYETIYTGEGDEMPGVMPGDLHIRFRIKKHKLFTRKGADLYIEKQISLLEALTGFNFEIPHLDGKKLVVTTIPGDVISPDCVKTIKNKGMPFFKDSYSYGNLFVKFAVQFPKEGSLKQKDIEALQKILPSTPQKPLPKNEKEYEYLDEFDEHELNPNPEGGRKIDEDDDEEEMGGRQNVQCAQQ